MEVTTYLKFLLALVFVLGLILALGWLLRRVGFGDGGRGPMGRRRRVRMIESAALDNRHKVVLVRRDDVEHLLLVGPGTSQVIERGIAAVTGEDAGIAPAPPASPFSAFRQLISKDKQP